MAINVISLKNFKCFKEINIDFSKITLLTGKNSSGKSSIIDGILAILQSQYPFYLSTNGKYIEMGDFQEISFNYKRENEISLDILIDTGGGPIGYRTCWIQDIKTKMPTLKYLKAESVILNFEISKAKNGYVLNAKFDENNLKKFGNEFTNVVSRVVQIVYDLTISQDKNKKPEQIKEDMRNILKFKNITNFSFENIDNMKESLVKNEFQFTAEFINMLSKWLAEEGEKTNYIGAFRISPSRTYYRKNKISKKVDQYGENCIDQILEWKDNKSKEYGELINILRELKLVNNIGIRQSGGGRFEPRIKINQSGAWSSLSDVGFGISQLLPIIVADLQMQKNSTLVVSQPEMHLHPSAQADLADYFIKQINEREKCYVLETHSEYILNRIRTGIVKGHLKPEDVSLYYFENVPSGSVYHKIELMKDGEIKGAPKGFFETYQMEVMNIAMSI